MSTKRKRPPDEELSQARMHLGWWIDDLGRISALAHDPAMQGDAGLALMSAKAATCRALRRYADAAAAVAEEGEP